MLIVFNYELISFHYFNMFLTDTLFDFLICTIYIVLLQHILPIRESMFMS